MLSNKPYLIRAFYDWIIDSRCTPILVVNANFPKCDIPEQYVENGEIVFNISPEAVRELNIRYDLIQFKASFSGQVQLVSVPAKAILAVYAEENKQGMYFDYEDEDFMQDDGTGTTTTTGTISPESFLQDSAKGKPVLRLIE